MVFGGMGGEFRWSMKGMEEMVGIVWERVYDLE